MQYEKVKFDPITSHLASSLDVVLMYIMSVRIPFLMTSSEEKSSSRMLIWEAVRFSFNPKYAWGERGQ